ncbi:MAG: DUF433 domain-containing protein [Acidobacteriota bacterium]
MRFVRNGDGILKDAKRAYPIICHIVTDPKICHGKPTFRGTRVLVSDVLEQVASGMAWETIIEEWNDSITKDAIKEAVSNPGAADRMG